MTVTFRLRVVISAPFWTEDLCTNHAPVRRSLGQCLSEKQAKGGAEKGTGKIDR